MESHSGRIDCCRQLQSTSVFQRASWSWIHYSDAVIVASAARRSNWTAGHRRWRSRCVVVGAPFRIWLRDDRNRYPLIALRSLLIGLSHCCRADERLDSSGSAWLIGVLIAPAGRYGPRNRVRDHDLSPNAMCHATSPAVDDP